jgi:hypothetical protein
MQKYAGRFEAGRQRRVDPPFVRAGDGLSEQSYR